jgi:hypothetical protein
MNPTNGIAVRGDTVQNANLYVVPFYRSDILGRKRVSLPGVDRAHPKPSLPSSSRLLNRYFFSWVSLGVAVYLAGSLLQETTGIEIKKSALTHGKTGKWYGFAASSIVVMVASVRVYQGAKCGGALQGQEYCRRTNLGIALGCISFVSGVSVACGMARQLVQSFVELLVSALLLTMWCFGVGFITFGTSPGAKIGNLYFSTWISFIVIVVIFAAVFRDYMAARSAAAASHHGGGDAEVAENGSGVPAVPDEEDI